MRAVSNLWGAMGRIYAEGGGVRAFWVGNGLNVMKIFPVRLLSADELSASSLHRGHAGTRPVCGQSG